MPKKILAFLIQLAMLLCCLIQPIPAAAGAPEEMNALVNGYGRPTAVLVYSMDGTTLYSYKAQTKLAGASLIKLPYCYWVCAQLENGVHSLDETITYTKSWYHGGSGIIYKGEYGVDYTIEQLLDYALRYSDNVAYDMLVYLFGVNGFNDMIARWGYDIRIGQTYPRFPMVHAAFMCETMRRMYIRSDDGGPWTIAWDALCHSKDTYVRGILGNENTPVAVKYGNVAAVWHEACYIDCEHPYILIVMSSATNYAPDVEYLESVAACAGRLNDEHVAALAAAAEPTESPTEPSTDAPTEPEPTTEPPTEPITEPITEPDPTEPNTAPQPGEVNADGQVNALDAQYILEAAALTGAGEDSGLTDAQFTAADLNADKFVDASDAASVLVYAAYLGAGGTDSIEVFLAA